MTLIHHTVLARSLAVLALAFLAPAASADTPTITDEAQALKTLKEDPSPQAKDAACVTLKRLGTPASIPALAALLPDPQLSIAARMALESMPYPEAGQALTAALDQATSVTRQGLMLSLGVRHEAAAVPKLVALLGEPEPADVAAAAAALGKIANDESLKGIQDALGKAGDATRVPLAAALLTAAERRRLDGDMAVANAAFKSLYQPGQAEQARLEAYLGMIRTSEAPRALRLALAGITGQDGAAQLAGLHAIRDLEQPETAKAAAEALPKLPPVLQVCVIEALGQRAEAASGVVATGVTLPADAAFAAAPAIVAVSKSEDPAVRLSALRTLGILGDAQAVARLVEAAGSKNEDEQKTARQALVDVRRGDVTGALLAELKSNEPGRQAEAARALAGRTDRAAVAPLIETARTAQGPARKAAQQAVATLADGSHLPALVALVVDAPTPADRKQSLETLQAACRHMREQGQPIDPKPILTGLQSAQGEARAALLAAATAVPDEGLRAVLREDLKSGDAALAEAARRALTESADTELMPDLSKLAREAADPADRVRAVRGFIRLALTESLPERAADVRVGQAREAVGLITRPDEKWLLLAGLVQQPCPESVTITLTMLNDPDAKAEAAQTAVKLADALKASHPELARAALNAVLASSQDAALREQATTALGALPPPPVAQSPATPFRHVVVDPLFRSEGVAVADFNRDGKLDIATGNLLYLGPEWKPVSMKTEPQAYNPEGYSNEFLCFPEEIDGDGWIDLIVVGFPGAQTRWLKNPGEAGGAWAEHIAVEKTGCESPDYLDVDKDGKKELVFSSEQGVAFARPGADPTQPWVLQVIAKAEEPKLGHGLGIGDLNGDGRNDILGPDGWWEAPADMTAVPWPFHAVKISDSPAQMIVLDADGDGDADVLSSSAHQLGLWMYERNGDAFEKRDIDATIGAMHALHPADLNGDGLSDLVSGKRFWAHRVGDAGSDDPSVVVWYELKREGGKANWTKYQLDDNSGVGLHFQIIDLNADGKLDIVTSSKKGVHAFVQGS